ncbi:hypothetical protein [Hymenobacter chitinivorans]|uniref:Uncharacterized protein n=1 Tax=Hymenobacter chitinivorans DSM 11115 TaxID=1121954 RepID=A0A2M9ASP3_9BACT|nr:hypothetical protein [Hymenobacter chitinivorans]PJJ48721.1 hypothetical protein CLV45_4431 [Hymenobacter chitinivorans DSM 11115]
MFDRPTTEERLNRSSSRGLVPYFTLLMALVYTGLGIMMWLPQANIFALPTTTRRILGSVFIFYGILRFARTYRQHFQQNKNHNAR